MIMLKFKNKNKLTFLKKITNTNLKTKFDTNKPNNIPIKKNLIQNSLNLLNSKSLSFTNSYTYSKIKTTNGIWRETIFPTNFCLL